MTISVVIVDDQALMREAFTMILNAQEDLHMVGDAADGQAGVELGAHHIRLPADHL